MSNVTILIVGHDAVLTGNLRDMLAARGHIVLNPAASGEDAVAAVEQSRPDLIVMDLEPAGNLSIIDIAEVIRISAGIPAIFLSGNIGSPRPRAARATAPYACLAKPVRENELIAAVELALSRSEPDRKLMEGEERFHLLFASMNSGFALHEIILDEGGKPHDYRFLAVNPAFERLTGLKSETLIGRTILEMLPNTEPFWIETYGRVALTGEPARFDHYSEEIGKYYDVTAYSPKHGQFATLFHDITDLKRTEETLGENLDLLDDTQHLAKVGGWVWNVERQTMAWTDETYRIHGFDPGDVPEDSSELIRRSLACYDPDDRPVIETAFRRCAEEGIPYDMVLPVTTVQGDRIWIQTRAHPVMEGNRIVRVMGNIMDITDRRHAEEALRESGEFIRAVMDNLPVGVAVNSVMPSVHFNYMNDNFLKTYRTTREALADPDAFWTSVYEDPVFREEIRKRVIVDIESGDPARMHWDDIPITRKGGETTYVNARNTPVSGRPLMISTVWDVTDRKRAAKALAESEERYREVFENTSDGFFLIDVGPGPRFTFSRFNPAQERAVGLSTADVAGKTPHELFERDLADTLTENYRKCVETGTTVSYEEELVLPAGRNWFYTSLVPVWNEAGEIYRIVGIGHTITESKLAGMALAESEKRYRDIFESVPVSIWEYDCTETMKIIEKIRPECSGDSNAYFNTHPEMLDTLAASLRLLDVNDETLRMYGARTKEDIFRGFGTHRLPEAVNAFRRFVSGFLGAEPILRIETVNETLDGRRINILLNAGFAEESFNKGRIIFSVLDITERKRAEMALQESEEKFRAAFMTSPDSVNINRLKDGVYVDINEGFTRITGYTREECMGKSSVEISVWADPKDRGRLVDELKEHGYVTNMEARFRMKDGAVRFGLMSARVLSINGEACILSVTRDITERKHAEQALRESEKKFGQLVAQSPISIEVYNADGLLIEANAAYEKLWHIPKETVIGKYNIIHHQHTRTNNILDQIQKAFRGEPAVLPLIRHDPNSSGDFPHSRERFVQPYIYPIIDEEGGVSQVVLIDIDVTEQQQLESQLQQAQKMESVGRLAGGVAHDFNNMLAVILMHTELLLMKMNHSDPHYADLKEIQDAGKRSAELTRQLLAFARKQTVMPKVLDLNDTIEGMLKMLRRLIGEDISLYWKPSPDLWQIRIDPSQIDQILANLCVNSRDAIKDVGKIIIETANNVFDDAFCDSNPGFTPGEYVTLSVSDNGCGIEKETISNIFEPFFTTKETGKGTGLGLSMVYGIVKQNLGFISVYSEPGEGTAFKIFFPRHVGKSDQAAPVNLTDTPMGGQETILLVEDEPTILELSKFILEDLGYTVLSAIAPGEALRLAGSYNGRIHLLMTDVVMPEMNGRDLAGKVLSLQPGIRRLYCSGYTADVIAQHGVLEEGVYFIEKPFTIRALAAKVREALS